MLPIFALWVFLLQNQYSKKNKNITALSLLELVGFFSHDMQNLRSALMVLTH